jgi:phage-related protein
MARGFEIAEGYLDINADVSDALKDVRRFFAQVDGELDAGEKAFKKSGEQSGKAYAAEIERAAKIDKVFKDLTAFALDAARSESDRRGGLSGALMGGGGRDRRLRDIMPNPSIFRRMFGGLKSAGKGLGGLFSGLFSGGAKLFKGLSKGIADAFSMGLDQAQQVWKSASGFFQQLSNIGGGVGGALQFGAMGVAVPLVLGLAGALLHLSAALLALPAAVAVAAAAIAPLIVAFKGFGEAVSAGLSGDVDAFNEALQRLTPSARKVAKEIVGLRDGFSRIKAATQEAFFAPLVGTFSKLGNTLLPALQSGLSRVAGAWGKVAAVFVNILSAPKTISQLNALFETTARIVERLGGVLPLLFGTMLNLITAALPYVERFAGVLASGLENVAGWLNAATAPGGRFAGWMERAWNVGKQLWEVLKGLGQYAFTLLNAFGDEGTDTLTGMADAIRKMNEYLQSAEGAETLHNLGVLVHWAGNAFVWFLGTLTSAWRGLNAVFSFIRGIGPFFSNLWDSIVSGAKGVGRWFADLWNNITGGVSSAASAVGGFFGMIGGWFVSAYNAVVSWGGKIVDWFVALPGRIGAFFMALPGIIGGAMATVAATLQYGIGYLAGLIVKFFTVDMPNWFRSGWEAAKTFTINGIMSIIAWANALPGQVSAAFGQLMDAIGGWFSRAWNSAKDATVNAALSIVAWAATVPGRVGGSLSRLMDSIGGWFSRAWANAKSATINGYNSVMAWINNLPGAVGRAFSGAGSWLVGAGRDIIRGLANGIASMLGWAVDQARNAANRIKSGFLDALGISSPSKVMDKEVGRWILPGVMAGIEHTRPKFDDYLGSSLDAIRGGRPVVNVAAPSVSVGGVTLLADLGDGIRRAVPVQIMRNPQVVATAASVGNRQRAAWTNTGRTAVTGTT